MDQILYKFKNTVNKAVLLLVVLPFFVMHAETIQIMPLGDSITEGYTDGSLPESLKVGYRQTLWLELVSNGYTDFDFIGELSNGWAATPAFDTDHEGLGGWSSATLQEYVYQILELKEPDIILLHIGSNDYSQDVRAMLRLY